MSIPAEYYQHPLDKLYLDKLRGVPCGVDTLLRTISGSLHEKMARIELLGNTVRVTAASFPQLKDPMPGIAARLGIPEPPVFVSGEGLPNAYTAGLDNPYVVVTAGLLYRVTPREIAGILAHECGHIACGHLLWQSVLNALLSGAGALSELAAKVINFLTPLLFKWYRASEFSADRAAAVAFGDPVPIQGGLMHLMTARTGFESAFDIDEICRQADELDRFLDDNTWNKILGHVRSLYMTHPWTILRIRELHRWTGSGGLASVFIDDDGNPRFQPGMPSPPAPAVLDDMALP